MREMISKGVFHAIAKRDFRLNRGPMWWNINLQAQLVSESASSCELPTVEADLRQGSHDRRESSEK